MARRPELDMLRDRWGVHIPAQDFLPPQYKSDFRLAMDAQPSLVTQSSSGIPAFLTQWVDPSTLRILLSPNKAAKILGEEKKGDWTTQTAMFPLVERTANVASYGDFNANGHAGANITYPQRQSFLYQTVIEYGELEMERAGLAKLSWATELEDAAVTGLNKFQNYTYLYGVAGLQNYGLTNDPSLSATLTPATKQAGGVRWVNTSNVIVATANEIYQDIQSLFIQVIGQANGNLDEESTYVLAMSPQSSVALTATNQYNVNVRDLLNKNFPNLTIETVPQYGGVSATNTQGMAAGNLIQLIATSVDGQDTGYCAFNEKLRSHPVIRDMSSFKKKITQGTWGAIIRQPFAIASMQGI
jgi:hypothetical protein